MAASLSITSIIFLRYRRPSHDEQGAAIGVGEAETRRRFGDLDPFTKLAIRVVHDDAVFGHVDISLGLDPPLLSPMGLTVGPEKVDRGSWRWDTQPVPMFCRVCGPLVRERARGMRGVQADRVGNHIESRCGNVLPFDFSRVWR
jgi:hypothetical protein